MFKLTFRYYVTVMPEPGGEGDRGATGPTGLPIFGRLVNPIPTGGGQIIPTYFYWHPQIFSPSGIAAVKVQIF